MAAKDTGLESYRQLETSDECRELLQRGWLALTPSQQWVRELHTELLQGEAGVLPAAMSVSSWVAGLWQQLALRGLEPFAGTGIVSEQQEQALWHWVLQQDDRLEPSTRAAMATLAMDAWDRSVLYQMPLEPGAAPAFPALERLTALERLAGWVKQFQQLCREGNLISRSEAMQQLVQAATSHRASLPRWPGIVLYGFVPESGEELGPEPTPLLRQMLLQYTDAVAQHQFIAGDLPPVRLYEADNLDHELAAAASWASEHPGEKMQIIVPNLAQHTERVRRLLTEYLGDDGDRWALRLGASAAQLPLLGDFQHWLELAIQPKAAEQVFALLRGSLLQPQLPVSDTALAQQMELSAWLELQLRRRRKLQFSAAELHGQLRGLLGAKPTSAAQRQWLQQLSGGLERVRQLPNKADLVKWAHLLYAELHALNALDAARAALPVRQALTNLLEQMAGLDAVLPEASLSLPEALFWLRWLAARVRLAASVGEADIWVGSGLDARPTEVAATWIASFDGNTWPRVTGGNPLLPARWQKDRAMPGADPQHSYNFARHLFHRLVSRSGQVMLSLSPASDGGLYEHSPLLGEMPPRKAARPPVPARPKPKAVPVVDADLGLPAWTDGERLQTSYIGTMQLMVDDPLAAFISARLGAEPLQPATQETNALTLGTSLHQLLQKILPAGADVRQALQQPDLPAQLDRLLQQLDSQQQPMPDHLRQQRSQMLKERIGAWLERENWPFDRTVQHTEHALQGTDPQGIPWRVRIDRIDTLPDGATVILDYKSGDSASAQLDKTLGRNGIQLLCYALALRGETQKWPAGLLYGLLNVKGGAQKYSGVVSANSELLESHTLGSSVKKAAMETLLPAQEQQLNLLRQSFAQARLGDGAGPADHLLLLRPQATLDIAGDLEQPD